MEKETANLLAIYERYKNDVLKYSAGIFTFICDFYKSHYYFI